MRKSRKSNGMRHKMTRKARSSSRTAGHSKLNPLWHRLATRASRPAGDNSAARPSLVQSKLRIGQPNDKYEREADQVADRVMRMSDEQIQRQTEEEEEYVQAKETPHSTPKPRPGLSARIQSMRGGGEPLPESTRSFFEPRFGHDFRDVRVHKDSRAAETAKSLNARAYTIGRDIGFGGAQLSPETT